MAPLQPVKQSSRRDEPPAGDEHDTGRGQQPSVALQPHATPSHAGGETPWIAGDSAPSAVTVNYRTVAKVIIAHIVSQQPLLVERLAADLVRLCFESDARIQAVELTVEKPWAVRFSRSMGVTVYRTRDEVVA